jgi:hypothetical protein
MLPTLARHDGEIVTAKRITDIANQALFLGRGKPIGEARRLVVSDSIGGHPRISSRRGTYLNALSRVRGRPPGLSEDTATTMGSRALRVADVLRKCMSRLSI